MKRIISLVLIALVSITFTAATAVPALRPVVRLGDRGTCIKKVQRVLNTHMLRESPKGAQLFTVETVQFSSVADNSASINV